ncbi:transmembrane protein 71-like [Takifugu rubripes]|uniref:transmembrane protein 71-like n=1 Tax=Takifugu rubripes TaxID=31033 RepID=UPI001145F72A|nr:transmembrane protein 71-like [Takifugu rubripes]
MLLAMTSFPPTSSAAARHAGKRLPEGGGQKLVSSFVPSVPCWTDQRNSFVQDGKQTQRVKKDAVATETGSTISRGRLCRRNMFFSGAVTSSPIRRRLRSEACQSLDVSLLSPDSSYICHPSADGSQLCSCRPLPAPPDQRLLQRHRGAFSWDHDGNVSLTPCKTSVSYKERLVRVFRRRRRPTGALARLLSDVTEGCQSWLDEKVFRGVFTAEGDQNHLWDRTGPESDQLDKSTWSELDKSTWSELDSADLDKGHGFTYDHTEAPPPPGKMTPPPTVLIQEEIGAEICQSKQTLAGLTEVPPPSHLYTGGSCSRVSPEHTGVTMTTVLLSIFVIFIVAAVNSGCLLWSAAVAAGASGLITTFAV